MTVKTHCAQTQTHRGNKEKRESERGGERKRERRTSEKNYKELDELNASEEVLAAAATPTHRAEVSVLPEAHSFRKELTVFRSQ